MEQQTQQQAGSHLTDFSNSVIMNSLKIKNLFLPRVAEFIYIEGDNKSVSSARIINFI